MPLARLKRLAGRLRGRLGEQTGSMLIEVMVGAVILGIATAAVLDGLEGAQKTGRMNKDRSVSSALAQQDIERLRALPIPALVGLNQTRAVDVKGVPHTVRSTTTWMRDNSSEISCNDDTSQAAYLKVVSTVSAPASADRPVTETTLITPPAAYSATTGTATVRTTDRDGKPLSGITINLVGTAGSYSGTTNELGCAIFTFIKPGNYSAQVPGNLVSWNSIRPANKELTVLAGKTTPAQMEIEQPASLRIRFKNPSGVAVSWDVASVPHSKLDDFYKVFAALPVPTRTTVLDAKDLFPQKDGYGIYAGDCIMNSPEYWEEDYFLNHPASRASVDPGATNVPIDAVLPVLSLTVTRNRQRPLYLTIDEVDKVESVDKPGELEINCQRNVYKRDGNFRDTDGMMFTSVKNGSTNATETALEYPLPFGNYRICVDDGQKRASTDAALTSLAKVSKSLSPIAKNAPNGVCSPAF